MFWGHYIKVIEELKLDQTKMPKINPAQFMQEVRRETSKVTWPSRKESGISTAMVFVMVIIAATFFFLVDQMLAFGVKTVLGIGA